MDETIRVLKVELDGQSYYENNPQVFIETVMDCPDGDVYSVSCVEISKEEYDKLPEFMGF